jgi:hypothetical protein
VLYTLGDAVTYYISLIRTPLYEFKILCVNSIRTFSLRPQDRDVEIPVLQCAERIAVHVIHNGLLFVLVIILVI